MTVHFDPIATTHRLELAGFKRAQAEALAQEMREAMLHLVTQEQLNAALDRQTIRIVGSLAAFITVACTVLGLVLSSIA